MGNIHFWRSRLLAPVYLRHGFTHRTGGISPAPFAELNLGLHVGDSPANVLENRRRAVEALGFPPVSLITAQQIHGTQVAVVNTAKPGNAFPGVAAETPTFPGTDALITNEPGLLLGLFFADCLPLFFADRRQPVVGIAHAGWRGLVGGIIENTVEHLIRCYGCDSDDILCAVGPGISKDYFEVGDEVAAQFPANTVHFHPSTGKPHVDLFYAARLRLQQMGLHSNHIEAADQCTFAESDCYFSHRRDSGRTGRMGGFIGIPSSK